MKIFFCHSKKLDPFSKIIQWATKSQWTHCGFILDPTLGGENMTAESVWSRGGPAIGFWLSHQWQAYEVYEFEALESDQMAFVKSVDGLKYSYAKILLLAVQILFGQGAREKMNSLLKKTGIWNDPWTDGLWCSEYCNAYFETFPKLKWIDKDAELIFPEDLYQAVKANAEFKLTSSN